MMIRIMLLSYGDLQPQLNDQIEKKKNDNKTKPVELFKMYLGDI